MRRMVACFFLWVLAALAAEPGTFAPERWRLAKPVSYQNLTIYPVLSDQTWDTGGFLTLDEGLASGKVRVSELDATRAQVDRLAVLNRSGRPLLLLAGEIIEGGNQDRMISEDQIVMPGEKPVPVGVYCVEPGRWQGRQSHFGALKAIVNPAVREQAVAHKSQEGVWARGGEARQRVMATAAPTSRNRPVADGDFAPNRADRALGQRTSYAELYRALAAKSPVEGTAGALKTQYEQALRGELKGQQVVGVVVEINRRPVWADVFASPGLFEKYWPKLLSSYVVEAVARRGEGVTAGGMSAREFLERKGGARIYQFSSRAQGKEAPLHLTKVAPGM